MTDEKFEIFSNHVKAWTIFATAQREALRVSLTAIADQAGINSVCGAFSVDDFYQKCWKDDLQRRLEKLENSDPGLAAKLLEMLETNP